MSQHGAMHVVALEKVGDEAAVARLAAALGRTGYEARALARLAGDAPAVVERLADAAAAARLAETLRQEGFAAFVLGEEDLETDADRFPVRTFRLGEGDLIARSRRDEEVAVPYREVDLLLAGRRLSFHTETRTIQGRKLSLGRALLTGGLMVSKPVHRREQVTREHREGFVHLYAGRRPPLAFREGDLLFDGLGEERQPSRRASFGRFVAELRRRAPQARFDDRLEDAAARARLVGRSAGQDGELDAAVSILVRVLRGSL